MSGEYVTVEPDESRFIRFASELIANQPFVVSALKAS
jgi:hypothetical protein